MIAIVIIISAEVNLTMTLNKGSVWVAMMIMVALNISKPESGSQVPKVGRLPWSSGETTACRGDQVGPHEGSTCSSGQTRGHGARWWVLSSKFSVASSVPTQGIVDIRKLKGRKGRGKEARTP